MVAVSVIDESPAFASAAVAAVCSCVAKSAAVVVRATVPARTTCPDSLLSSPPAVNTTVYVLPLCVTVADTPPGSRPIRADCTADGAAPTVSGWAGREVRAVEQLGVTVTLNGLTRVPLLVSLPPSPVMFATCWPASAFWNVIVQSPAEPPTLTLVVPASGPSTLSTAGSRSACSADVVAFQSIGPVTFEPCTVLVDGGEPAVRTVDPLSVNGELPALR